MSVLCVCVYVCACVCAHACVCVLVCVCVCVSVGRYHIFTSGIQYYKLRTVFGIPRYLIKQVDQSLSSVNG